MNTSGARIRVQIEGMAGRPPTAASSPSQRGAFATIVHRKHTGAISPPMADRLLASFKQLYLETEGGRQWLAGAKSTLSRLEQQELGLED